MINLLDLSLCDTSSVLRSLKIVYIFMKFARIIVPLLIIMVGTKDFVNVVTNGKDDEFKKVLSIMVRRIIAGLVIFFIPSIINYALSLNASSKSTVSEFASCSVCLTNDKECDSLIASSELKEEEVLAANHDSADDEASLRAAYEAEMKQKESKRQSFEDWKKATETKRNNYRNKNDDNTSSNIKRETVSQGKYFDSTNVSKISGLSESELSNILRNSSAYKGKAKIYLPYVHDLIAAEKNHGVNAFYLIGVYSLESGWMGSNLAKNCNNLGGVKFYNQTYGNGKKTTNCSNGFAGFDSKSEFIDFHASLLERKYLTPGASHYHGTSVAGIAQDYGHEGGVDTIIQIATYVSTK